MNKAAKIAVELLRFVYFFIKLLPQKNRIVILSRQHRKISGDVRMLSDALKEKYPEIQCLVLVRMIDSWTYIFHLFRQMFSIAMSRVVVLDGFCITASVLKHKEGTRIIQMWHSSAAIKKFGYQTIDRPSGHNKILAETMCMHRNYDYVIAPGRETGRFFCQGFQVTEDKLRYYGLPRLSEITKEDKEWRERARRRLMGDDTRELLVYVPTFRKGKAIDAGELISSLDRDRFRLVIKPHPLDELDAGREYVCREFSSTELIRIGDRIITDYSALGVEASVLDKPLYYYVYDIEEYKRDTGLNIDPLVEMPQCSSASGKELVQMMNKDYDFEKLRAFRQKFIEVPTGGCSERLADFIVGILNGND